MPRPTLTPVSYQLVFRILGQRGSLIVQPCAEATLDPYDHRLKAAIGEPLADDSGDSEPARKHVFLSPLRPTSLTAARSERRYARRGVFYYVNEAADRQAIDFVQWWPGEWVEAGYRLRPSAELDFLIEGVKRLVESSARVEIAPALREVWLPSPLQAEVDLEVQGNQLALRVTPYAGDMLVSPVALAETVGKGRTWTSVRGKAVAIPPGLDVQLLHRASEAPSFVTLDKRDQLLFALRLMGDPKVADGMRPVLEAVVKQPPAELVPPEVHATLRPYQVEGFAWLKRVIGTGTGGLLADEQGTGKTLQTLAAFCGLHKTNPRFRLLVVCPKTLIFNWAEEIKKFVPHFNVTIWSGPTRKKLAHTLKTSTVVITSYYLLPRDIDILEECYFDLLVFDEAQHVKTDGTANRTALSRMKAGVRLALSGTPIENRLDDLWSLMDLCTPGLLPPLDEFKEKIVRPFKAGDVEVAEQLRETIRPYVLRRTKAQVATDLPEKQIVNQLCEMTANQMQEYDQLYRTTIANLGKSNAVSLFAALGNLRQIATDPRLKDPMGRFKAEDSGKILMFRDLLDAILSDPTNKVLIFSQWVEMLNLVRPELESRKLKFSTITGQTSDRQAQVHQFQNDPDVRAFLISLKAGGAGLNLTAANFVVLFDPWWNPAVEAQAFDRAHRIGQKRMVTVYRLIAKDTIEERINDMQDRKQAVSAGIIDDAVIPDFSEADIVSLLAP